VAKGPTANGRFHGTHASRDGVVGVLRRIGRAIRVMELPAIEKLQ
jgi:hypothetical protein